jgi:hypothetical protein
MLSLVDTLRFVAADAFDNLDDVAGAAGSHSRRLQLERTKQWSTRYLISVVEGDLCAAVPLYVCRALNWPDPEYNPRSWGARIDCRPNDALLVGGRSDYRSSMHVSMIIPPAALRLLVRRLAEIAVRTGRALIFPFFYMETVELLDEFIRDAVAWFELGEDGEYVGTSTDTWEMNLPKDARYTWRRDRRAIAEAGVEVELTDWNNAKTYAASLIADHNNRKRLMDRPELVNARYQRWISCPDIEVVVFDGHTESCRGVSTGLVWRNNLEMHEIGVPDANGMANSRLSLYLALGAHAPIAYAQDRCLGRIRLGRGSRPSKSNRGAEFRRLYGGVATPRALEHLLEYC